MALRLGVVFGGRSVEHEVSVVSAMSVLREADPARFDVVPFGVTRAGRWLTPDETRAQLARGDAPYEKRMEGDVPPLLARDAVLHEVRSLDAVFPLVHGHFGEDGTMQGMLEMWELPYAGCAVAASAIAMDKSLQKQICEWAGLKVARSMTVRAADWRAEGERIARCAESMVGYPAFVKPATGGSSVGVSVARSREDLGEALEAAFRIDGKALIEERIEGREVECGVIASAASPVGEVIPAGEFYDYRAKYLEDSARLVAPADLPADVADAVRERAVAAFDAVDGGRGFARIDFFVTPDGEIVLNEINTIPGFTPISMFPRLWGLAGVSYPDLITRLVDLGLERAQERRARDAGR